MLENYVEQDWGRPRTISLHAEYLEGNGCSLFKGTASTTIRWFAEIQRKNCPIVRSSDWNSIQKCCFWAKTIRRFSLKDKMNYWSSLLWSKQKYGNDNMATETYQIDQTKGRPFMSPARTWRLTANSILINSAEKADMSIFRLFK